MDANRYIQLGENSKNAGDKHHCLNRAGWSHELVCATEGESTCHWF